MTLFPGRGPKVVTVAASVNSNSAATTQGTSAGFVVNGSQATMVETLGKAIAAIQKRADQAASDGKTDLHDAFANSIPTYQALLEKARTQGLHPSLYPFTLGKKGCLFAFRQGKFAAGPAAESLMVPVQTVSWMRFAITTQRNDGSRPVRRRLRAVPDQPFGRDVLCTSRQSIRGHNQRRTDSPANQGLAGWLVREPGTNFSDTELMQYRWPVG